MGHFKIDDDDDEERRRKEWEKNYNFFHATLISKIRKNYHYVI